METLIEKGKVLHIEIPPEGFSTLQEQHDEPISLADAIIKTIYEQKKIEEFLLLNSDFKN